MKLRAYLKGYFAAAQTAALTAVMTATIISTATPSHATEILKLKPHVSVTGDIVTLGDIFEKVTAHRNTAIFKSPALGREGTVGLAQLIETAERFGFTFDTPLHIKAITVARPARTIPASVFKGQITKALAKHLPKREDGNYQLTFSAPFSGHQIPLAHSGEMKLTAFAYNRASKRFTATFAPVDAASERYNKTLTGTAGLTYNRPVLLRAVKRGETITAADIEQKPYAPTRIPATAISRLVDIIGMTANKSLRSGAFVKATDLEIPKMVSKNQLVTLVFEKHGLILKTRGKAMDDGAKDQSISVMNINSKRVVQGTIKAPGLVIINDNDYAGSLQQTANLN